MIGRRTRDPRYLRAPVQDGLREMLEARPGDLDAPIGAAADALRRGDLGEAEELVRRVWDAASTLAAAAGNTLEALSAARADQPENYILIDRAERMVGFVSARPRPCDITRLETRRAELAGLGLLERLLSGGYRRPVREGADPAP